MVLYVGGDGLLVDGPLPPGPSTKVVALVDGRPVEVYVINNPGGGGAPNFLARQTIGVQVQAVLSAIAAAATVGVGVTPRIAVVSAQTVGVAATPLVSGTVKPPVLAGLAVNSILDGPKTLLGLGAEIVQIRYDLTARNGSNAATNTGPQSYTNPASAQGYKDGAYAAIAGEAVSARSATLRLAYAAQVNKTQLTITGVELRFYTDLTSSLGGSTTTLRATWTGGSYTGPVRNTTYSDLVTPTTVDLFALGVTDWATVNSVLSFVDGTTPVGATSLNSFIAVDAVELVITANRTDTL